MYKVVKKFTDLKDNGYTYEVGDEYPRENLVVDKNRIGQLLGDKNRQKTPLIEEVKTKPIKAKDVEEPKEQPKEKVEEVKEKKPRGRGTSKKK